MVLGGGGAKIVCQYVSDVCIVSSPCLCQCSLTCLGISFPNFYPVVGRGRKDPSAVEVDMKHSNSILVAGLKVIYRCHSLQQAQRKGKIIEYSVFQGRGREQQEPKDNWNDLDTVAMYAELEKIGSLAKRPSALVEAASNQQLTHTMWLVIVCRKVLAPPMQHPSGLSSGPKPRPLVPIR
jgi:hypothetical protein